MREEVRREMSQSTMIQSIGEEPLLRKLAKEHLVLCQLRLGAMSRTEGNLHILTIICSRLLQSSRELANQPKALT